MAKKIVVWGGLSFLLFFIAADPDNASDIFSTMGGVIRNVATNLGDFFTQLNG